MARLKMVAKNPGSTYTMNIKENIHTARSKRYKKYIIALSFISLLEFSAIIYGVMYHVYR